MSLTYSPIAEIVPHCKSQDDDGGWDVNSSGANLLGGLHSQLNLPVCNSEHIISDCPRVPYSMDKVIAEATARKLSGISDEDVKATLERFKSCWVDELDAVNCYLEWVRDWQKFLEVCGGYKTE